MIEHVVMMRLRAGHDPVELSAVMDGLADLADALPGMDDFAYGPNRDYEGLSPEFDAGFVARFRDSAALATYSADPRHKALGARLIALCDGGLAGLMVFDLET